MRLEQPFQPLAGLAVALRIHVQLDARQVVDDVVRALVQQRLQSAAGFLQLTGAAQADGQAVAGGVVLRAFLQLRTEALGGQPRRAFELQLGTGAHQLVGQAVGLAAGRRLLGAVAAVGDARFGQRVGEQELRRLGVVAVLAGQALEHAGHATRVVAGVAQVAQADAVGFLLVLPREAALALDGGGLPGGDGGDGGIPGAGRRGDHAGEHGRHQRQLHALLRFQAACVMALRQVGQFVGEHRGELGFGLRVQEQPAVDADDAARHGEGVELRAVEDHELQAAVLQLAGLGQAVDVAFDEVLEQRVRQLRDLAAQHAQPGAAELVLLFGRDDGRAGVAQRRQVIGARHRAQGQADGKQQQGRARGGHAGTRSNRGANCSLGPASLASGVGAWVFSPAHCAEV